MQSCCLAENPSAGLGWLRGSQGGWLIALLNGFDACGQGCATTYTTCLIRDTSGQASGVHLHGFDRVYVCPIWLADWCGVISGADKPMVGSAMLHMPPADVSLGGAVRQASCTPTHPPFTNERLDSRTLRRRFGSTMPVVVADIVIRVHQFLGCFMNL